MVLCCLLSSHFVTSCASKHTPTSPGRLSDNIFLKLFYCPKNRARCRRIKGGLLHVVFIVVSGIVIVVIVIVVLIVVIVVIVIVSFMASNDVK